MILSTFRHIRGVGPKRERILWKAGIRTWIEAISDNSVANLVRILPNTIVQTFRAELRQAYQELKAGDIRSLAKRFDLADHWLLLDYFPERALYLDIETGIDRSGINSITIIGTYCTSNGYMVFLDGKDIQLFPDYLAQFEIIVTFNGKSFDVPLIRKSFRNIAIPEVHVDLMLSGRRAGIRGPLKKIEKLFKIKRDPEVDGLDGYDAVLLWEKWINETDHASLEKLIKYNKCDTVHLETLARIIIGELKKKTGRYLLSSENIFT